MQGAAESAGGGISAECEPSCRRAQHWTCLRRCKWLRTLGSLNHATMDTPPPEYRYQVPLQILSAWEDYLDPRWKPSELMFGIKNAHLFLATPILNFQDTIHWNTVDVGIYCLCAEMGGRVKSSRYRGHTWMWERHKTTSIWFWSTQQASSTG
jgi:hypothetical protein